MNHTLLLGSKSYSRKMLLTQAQIPFTLLEQNADETRCDWKLPLPLLVAQIALLKMGHVIIPDGKNEGQICFVLTADTMSQDSNGVIHGKPVDRVDAIAKIKAAAHGNYLCTAFCLDKRIWKSGRWQLQKRIQEVVAAEYLFIIPDQWIDRYLQKSIALQTSGAIAIEEFGVQFLKTVQGSYSTIVGLPMFELRQALEQADFFTF